MTLPEQISNIIVFCTISIAAYIIFYSILEYRDWKRRNR